MQFKIEKKLTGNLGRAGILTTAHGVIHTPAFVPVGTKASVKSLTPEEVSGLGAEVVLSNTYHLYLQPGDELVAKAGGLHKFMNWNGPIITDSGGFQVFSLGAAYGKDFSKVIKGIEPTFQIPERFDDYDAPRLANIGQDGVSFKSHLDGSVHYITPEKSIQIQHNLGADIIFAFDECTSPMEDKKYQEEALVRTHRWAERCLEEHKRLLSKEFPPLLTKEGNEGRFLKNSPHPNPLLVKERGNSSSTALFGIVQGGRDEKLRKKSAEFIGGLDFDGFGIGGSFAKEDMKTAVRWVNEILPEGKPRHLLGIGEPEDLFMGVENGVDLFDCVAPTRNARNGSLYTKNGKINIMNAKYREDFSPVEEGCGCYVCFAPKDSSAGSLSVPAGTALPLGPSACETPRKGISGAPRYSRAYVAHLFHGKEMLAATLASIHNLYFIINLVKKIRQSILDENFFEFKKEFFKNYPDSA